MLQLKTIEPFTLELLKDLSSKTYLNSFVLVGGTALALQLGHRKSIDLDFFSVESFQSTQLLENLLPDFDIHINQQTERAIISNINGVKVDFIHFKYPFQNPILEKDSIRLASIEDIAAMKLDAIAGRGNKKDFFDLYFLLEKFSIEQLLGFYTEKYPHQTTFHMVRSLTYFEDAEIQPDPIVINTNITWKMVKKQIENTIKKI
jgi:predicted nucleotidyltransferase component of viral defense system